ncbi:GNAT family N-acetyltransferase [Salinicoccus jeotgali]|uniref:GNAT family N-acetyltransferase n=1 Tax=Salinicoccus jeotgali TaxID=381634 RepID=A0ABP7EBE4_9STAP
MDQISIRPFQENDRETLAAFRLSEQQQVYSSLPTDVVDDAVDDPDRVPCVVLNGGGTIIGFFVLHKHYQHEGYDTPHEVVYIRSLSIDEKLQGRGYGTQVAMRLPIYIQENFSNFDHLYLVVDAENTAAWNLYERAGFTHTATKEDGPIGKERLYYLDLDSKYVHNIKLGRDDAVQLPAIKIDIVRNQKETIGEIKGKVDRAELRITHLHVKAQERERGVASSAMRQIATFLRRDMPEIKQLTILTDDAAGWHKLFEKGGFVMMEDEGGQQKFVKYVNY